MVTYRLASRIMTDVFKAGDWIGAGQQAPEGATVLSVIDIQSALNEDGR